MRVVSGADVCVSRFDGVSSDSVGTWSGVMANMRVFFSMLTSI